MKIYIYNTRNCTTRRFPSISLEEHGHVPRRSKLSNNSSKQAWSRERNSHSPYAVYRLYFWPEWDRLVFVFITLQRVLSLSLSLFFPRSRLNRGEWGDEIEEREARKRVNRPPIITECTRSKWSRVERSRSGGREGEKGGRRREFFRGLVVPRNFCQLFLPSTRKDRISWFFWIDEIYAGNVRIS